MRILVVGGSGTLGRRLVERLRRDGDNVSITTRSAGRPEGIHPDVGVLRWDTESDPVWDEPFQGVINLAGEELVGSYWSEQHKRELWRSRVDTNRLLAQWIQSSRAPPSVFVTASAVGYYGGSPPGPVTEDAPPGDDFLARLCKEWESAAFAASSDRTRVVATRFGLMMDPDGGPLAKMVPIWKVFLGGHVGSGHQPFPWVSTRDAARAIQRALHDASIQGPINVVAPEHITNKEFTAALGHAVHRPAPWYVPPFALRVLYGEGGEILTQGQHVVPKRLQENGFDWEDARIGPTLDRLVDGHP